MVKIFVFYIFLTFGVSGFDPESHKNWNHLPHKICGQVDSSRIIGGKEAPMNGYPWMVRIGVLLLPSAPAIFYCGGSVVSSRTVLTAAHCVTDLSIGDRTKVVRFGEHNTKTNPDCDGSYCADPVTDMIPSEIIIHKDFNNPLYKNDIALIRFSEDIKFSDSVKPICLGGKEFMHKSLIGTMAEVAGWGVYDIVSGKVSKVLQYVTLEIVNITKCRSKYPKFITIGPTQICAGGVVGMDSCGGDSGGPLMQVNDGALGPQYYLLGLVSFGPKKCGATPTPAVYTNMSIYMKWYLDNFEKSTASSLKVY